LGFEVSVPRNPEEARLVAKRVAILWVAIRLDLARRWSQVVLDGGIGYI